LRELLSTFVNALISAEPDAVYGARRYRGLDVLARAVAATKEVTEQPIIQALTPNYIPHHHGGIGGDRDFETLLVSRVVSDFTVRFWDNGVCLLLPRYCCGPVMSPS